MGFVEKVRVLVGNDDPTWDKPPLVVLIVRDRNTKTFNISFSAIQ